MAGTASNRLNIEAIVTRRVDGELRKVIIGRHCEGCGDRHDGEMFGGGARYLIGARWLCVECMQK